MVIYVLILNQHEAKQGAGQEAPQHDSSIRVVLRTLQAEMLQALSLCVRTQTDHV